MHVYLSLQASLAALSVNPAHPELSRFYVHTMRSVSKRLVLRMCVCTCIHPITTCISIHFYIHKTITQGSQC